MTKEKFSFLKTTHRAIIQKIKAKLHELKNELLPHPLYTPYLAPRDYWLFSDLKKMLPVTFRTNEEVISESKAYFEGKEETFYKNGI